MEQQFSTSKVTVEYFDPHDVYKLVASGLIPRLPLRNLNWQSHAGPLRSIDTLHIELVSEDSRDQLAAILSSDNLVSSRKRSDTVNTTASTATTATTHTTHTTHSREDGFQTQIGSAASTESVNKTSGRRSSVAPARRHQIPGLRKTPYLKVLLVRCDDNDSYKSSVRQEIRDWIKAQTPSTGSTKKMNAAENHDAFEWLIVHVVIPNTVAATQPRTNGNTEDSAASRWRVGSSTLLEKMRSDFNSSNKGAVDRIAQIRIGVNDVPYDDLPRVVPAVPSGYKETAEENENAWQDLISKFKSLILSSFDLRVTQYEEDIKEKDAQRTLPGWNFCTFFILKEGLARGFESVGLVEDALVGYDELSVGLDMVIKELEADSSASAATTLLKYTDELRQIADKTIGVISNAGGDEEEEIVDIQAGESMNQDSQDSFGDIPINAKKKPYRDMILENKVSIFDFKCYIFARQMSLLLRLGNALSTREELLAKLKEQQEGIVPGVAPMAPPPKQVENDSENLPMLAEICTRALEFIPAVGPVMRRDIEAALAAERTPIEGENSGPPPDPAAMEVIDNLIASFAFSIAQQVLAQTSTKSLPIPPSTLAPSDGHEPKTSIPEPKTMMHPARSSSLQIRPGSVAAAALASPAFFTAGAADQAATGQSSYLKAGLEELAASRAELYNLSRNILEEAGKKRGWSDGWADVPIVSESAMFNMVDINLDEDTEPGPEAPIVNPESPVFLAGIENQLLRTALDNDQDFYRLYEMLTDKALRHYTVADHLHSVQSCLADLAILKYHLEDYGAAASFFWRTTPFFGENGWSLLELTMLVMYSRCLKKLERKDEYVKVVLKLLSKAAVAELDRQQRRNTLRIGNKEEVKFPDSDAVKGFLDDLLIETRAQDHELRVPLQSFFSGVDVNATPDYHEGRDGFSMSLKLNYLLLDELKIENARLLMVSQVTGGQREIWLELLEPVTLKHGNNRLTLESNTVIPGLYDVTRIEMTTSQLCLQYERDPSEVDDFLRAPRITVYHRANALDVRLTPSDDIQLDQNNSVDIDLTTGWNELTNAEIRVRAATGGLRLLTAEAESVSEAFSFSKKPEGGLFCFEAIPRDTSVKIRFPYTVEQELLHVSIRIDVNYKTEHGSYVFSTTPTIAISLALGVNVQDVFKHKALYSRFTVSTATASPLRLYKSELAACEAFNSSFGVPSSRPVAIFPKQPACLLYRITPKKGAKAAASDSSKTMYLKLYYSVVLDEIGTLVGSRITEAVKDTHLQGYTHLLVQKIVPHVQTDLGPIDIERATLLGSVSTAFLSKIDWNAHFTGLGKSVDGTDIAATLASFIQTWQKAHPSLILPDPAQLESPKSISIPVDIPPVTIVHTTDIRIQPAPNGQSTTTSSLSLAELPYDPSFPAITTNQVLPATLHLRWTRIWDTSTPHAEMADLEFSYEVVAPVDTWLVGGRRKGHFVIPAPAHGEDGEDDMTSSTPETEADIPLLLIPLREGFLPYPSVDIREVQPLPSPAPHPAAAASTSSPAPSSPSAAKGGARNSTGPAAATLSPNGANGAPGSPATEGTELGGGSAVHCEIDHRNLGETVRVVPDRESITISLDASGPGGGPLVLDVGRRGGVGVGRVVA